MTWSVLSWFNQIPFGFHRREDVARHLVPTETLPDAAAIPAVVRDAVGRVNASGWWSANISGDAHHRRARPADDSVQHVAARRRNLPVRKTLGAAGLFRSSVCGTLCRIRRSVKLSR
jgi:hypothetical protein